MATQDEKAPLLGSSGNNNNGGKTYYFNNTTQESASSRYNDAVSDNDGGHEVETLPSGASAQDFEPRLIGAVTKVR
jgi:Mor family transcriptional regulator